MSSSASLMDISSALKFFESVHELGWRSSARQYPGDNPFFCSKSCLRSTDICTSLVSPEKLSVERQQEYTPLPFLSLYFRPSFICAQLENVRLAQKYKIRNVSRAQDKTCNRRIKMKMKNKNIKEKTCNRRMKKETEKKKPSASLF